MHEKRCLLNFVFSNSSWKDGRLTPVYRKPFDLLAVTNLAYQREKALSPSKDGLFDIWLPFLDSFRTFLITESESFHPGGEPF
jgi:hypothetical protein